MEKFPESWQHSAMNMRSTACMSTWEFPARSMGFAASTEFAGGCPPSCPSLQTRPSGAARTRVLRVGGPFNPAAEPRRGARRISPTKTITTNTSPPSLALAARLTADSLRGTPGCPKTSPHWKCGLPMRHCNPDLPSSLALLCRGLVAALLHGEPRPDSTPTGEFLDAALWRAAGYDLPDQLVHPLRQTLVPAADALASLLDATAPALTAHGDLAAVTAMLQEQQSRGSGAYQERKNIAADGRSGLGKLFTGNMAPSMGAWALDTTSPGAVPGARADSAAVDASAGPVTAGAQLPDPAL